jgi:hypothetical protein
VPLNVILPIGEIAKYGNQKRRGNAEMCNAGMQECRNAGNAGMQECRNAEARKKS